MTRGVFVAGGAVEEDGEAEIYTHLLVGEIAARHWLACAGGGGLRLGPLQRARGYTQGEESGQIM